MSEIDPRAAVSPRARLGRNVRVGPFAVIGDEVELGDDSIVHAHVSLSGPASFGRGNVFFPFCALGGNPQDLKYRGEPTRLEAGDENEFREFVTVNRGTAQGHGVTRLGSRNLLMCYSHVAHDCTLGDHVVLVNAATLAGHVTIDDYATLGAFCPVHQYCRIGRHAYIAAHTVITQDVPPFAKVVAPRETRCYGANAIGIERQGFSPERVAAIQQAYRLLLRSKMNTTQALDTMKETLTGSADVEEMVRFIEGAERGITK
ncbi:MAG TPA: acyl-ACP--UDP-N-acetylglucosamine O-acyltransferase [Candidatus Dormibacteraeota bacterium]|nr:acyl-ACP--UDP-N-acetylglucosamine O-acyltransferase [Candidatus Dormibacteraeota bacterium]